MMLNMIPPGLQSFYLRSLHPKDKNVLFPYLLKNLNVGPVQGPHGHRTVEHQLHVPGAAGLGPGQGNLLRDLRRRHQTFTHGDVVLLNKDYLQLAPGIGIVVNNRRQIVDELENLLGQVVPRRRLGPEDVGLGQEGSVGVLLDPEILGQNVQGVEVLALVLVKPLYLNVKNGVGIYGDAPLLLEVPGKVRFVGRFDLCQAL